MNLDATAKPGADAISYSLRKVSPTEKEDSLRYREAANYVRTALSGRGLFEAPDGVVPDVIVDLEYGIKKRTKREKRAYHVDDDPHGFTPGYTRGRTAYYDDVHVTTTYEKYVQLTARENTPGMQDASAVEIWRVDVASEGKSRNLRKYLPILVAASIEYVGKDSRGQKSIRLKDTDADVVFVKKGM